MDPKPEGKQDEEDNGRNFIDIKNHEENKDRTVEAIRGDTYREDEGMISTDEDTYWFNLENIETSILGEENVQKKCSIYQV